MVKHTQTTRRLLPTNYLSIRPVKGFTPAFWREMLSPSRLQKFWEIFRILAFVIYFYNCLKFEKNAEIVFACACYSSICSLFFFIAFFHFFCGIPEATKAHEPIRHRFGSHLCFLLCNEKSEKQNKAKTPMRALSYSIQRWLTR